MIGQPHYIAQEKMIGGKDRKEGMRMRYIIGQQSLEDVKMQQRICRSVGKHERHVLTLSTLMTIVMVVLLLLSIALVLVSVARADIVNRTFTREGGVVTYAGELRCGTDDGFEDEPNKIIVFEGEKIKFKNEMTGAQDIIITGPYDDDGDTKSGCKDYPPVTKNTSWDCSEDNYYFKVWEEVANPDIGGWFGADEHSFSLELEKKEKVRERENFNLTMKKNNKREGVMKLTIEDDSGYSIMNESGTDIYEILIEYKNDTEFSNFYQEPVGGTNFEDNKLVFNTSELDMKEGKYKIILEDYATEAEDDVKIEVEKRYLKVECDDVVKGKDIVIIIRSSFYEIEANVTVEDIYENKRPLTLDEEGKKKVKISTENENVDYGTYKVTVEVLGYDMKETKYVTIKREGSSLEVPDNATVGDIIPIKGSSDFGDLAVLVIDDVFKGKARISADKFEWDWDTRGELDGYREIEVFIVNESFSEELVSEQWQKNEGVDASATIFLLLPMFSMNVPEDIAEGDDVVISGTAIGADHVYVIVINYKGEVVFPPGENARATPVEEGTWEEKIRDLDTGRYVVISLDKGRDEETNAIENRVWAAGGGGKTMEQRVAILEAAITSAGSDDMFELAYFSVSTPQVSLDLPETAEVDDELRVTAETNIKDGEKAFLSLSFNTNIIKTTSTLIEDGSVDANINTSGLQPGRYNVAVYIRGRASDEKEVILVEKTEVEGEESIPQNESLAEPEAMAEVNESLGGGNKSQEEQEIPVNMWDVLIALAMATFVSVGLKRRCH